MTWLTLVRPERLNAFTGSGYLALRRAIEEAALDPSVHVVVITGEGRAFCAGADRSLVDGSATDDERTLAGVEFAAMLDALDACDKPVLAAVNGLAVGIGCTILLHCDLVVVADSARLRLPFTALGIVPEAGSSALLPLRARSSEATWAMLSSEWIDAQAAVSMGLAWRVAPEHEVASQTEAAAMHLSSLDPRSVQATKRLMTAGRAEVSRAAMARELGELSALLPPSTPSASHH